MLRQAAVHRQPKVTLSLAPERSAATHASLSTNPDCQAPRYFCRAAPLRACASIHGYVRLIPATSEKRACQPVEQMRALSQIA